MTKLLSASIAIAALLAVLPASRILPVSADENNDNDNTDSGGVDFSEFVEYSSTVDSADVNGLYLTLGETIGDERIGYQDSGAACLIGGKDFKGPMNNIVHTIEPVFFNATTKTTPGITISSYPEGLINAIFYGEENGDKFLRLSYNEELLVPTDTPPTEISDPDTNETTYEYPSYGVWIQFPSRELEEVHLGGDIIVQIKEGFTNMTLLRVTDRVQVRAASKLPFFNDNNATKTFEVRSSQNAMVTLDVGHDKVKPVEAIASDNSTLSIRGSVRTIECVNNSTCVVDGKILSEDCNDSLIAANATLETDDCACVMVVTILTNLNESSTSSAKSASRTTVFGEEFNINGVATSINNYNTAKCLDTTYIPPVVATTNGPSTTNAIFSCPAEKIIASGNDDSSSSSTGGSSGDTPSSSNDENSALQEDAASSVVILRVVFMTMASLLSAFVLA